MSTLRTVLRCGAAWTTASIPLHGGLSHKGHSQIIDWAYPSRMPCGTNFADNSPTRPSGTGNRWSRQTASILPVSYSSADDASVCVPVSLLGLRFFNHFVNLRRGNTLEKLDVLSQCAAELLRIGPNGLQPFGGKLVPWCRGRT